MYRICGHCEKRVSEKTFKEHRRLFFHDQKWIKETVPQEVYGLESRASSPLCVSDPMSDVSQHEPDDVSSDEDTTSFPAFNDIDTSQSPEKGK